MVAWHRRSSSRLGGSINARRHNEVEGVGGWGPKIQKNLEFIIPFCFVLMKSMPSNKKKRKSTSEISIGKF